MPEVRKDTIRTVRPRMGCPVHYEQVSDTDGRWSILFVCTGNICRSPMAERMTQGALAARFPNAGSFQVASAGTRGLEGYPMERNARKTLRERGADPDGFVARELDAWIVEAADVVLCATRAHRSDVVTLCPRALRRTFTIREFGRLTSGITPGAIAGETLRDAGRALTDRAIAGRGARGGTLAEDDIPDPYRQDLDAFRGCAQLIADGLRGPVDLLTVAAGGPRR